MADSSPCELSCFQCMETNSSSFRNAWRLRNGQFAQLCDRCSSLYEEGKFCGTFHSNDDGWRDCKICGKLIHCGCIASINAFIHLDLGGVSCMECWKIKERKQNLETKQENKEAQGELVNQIQIKPQYWPRATASELEQVVRNNFFPCNQIKSGCKPLLWLSNSSVSPLFEKILSSTDVDRKRGRLIIPKQCAKAYFPKITTHDGCPISILDAEGKEWNFRFQYWNCRGYKKYVLKGLHDFMVSKQWQRGDVVTFFRTEREEKLVMGLRKTHSCQQPYEIQGSSERDNSL